MNEDHAGRPKIKWNHDQRKYRNGHHITHGRRVVEKIENDNATDQHNAHGKCVGNVHGAIKKSGFHFISQVAMGTIFMHLSEI
jgi:hypothetical protein